MTLQEGADMKFNYFTIGTNKFVEVDTDNLFISNESKVFGEKLLSKIIKGNGEKVKILDGIWVEGWIEKNIFEIAIVDGKGNPIICSFGTTKEEEQSTLAHHISYIWAGIHLKRPEIKKCNGPVMYEICYWDTLKGNTINEWLGCLLRSLGAIAFETIKEMSK